jgi:mannose-1-phosphate guanylyltransferase/phosphomannomutase
MKAIILAGGKGERLRPITENMAKPMVQVQGKPVLEHLINLLKKHGITDLIICLCYLPDSVTSYFGDGTDFGVRIEYIFEDPNVPLGTAGSVLSLSRRENEDFIVVYADILRDLDISEMIKYHNENRSIATLNVYREYKQVPRSQIIFDENQKIVNFVEHPDIENKDGSFVYTNGSFYILSPEILKNIEPKMPLDFSLDIFPVLLEKKLPLLAFPSFGYFLDIGTKEKLAGAQMSYNQPK